MECPCKEKTKRGMVAIETFANIDREITPCIEGYHLKMGSCIPSKLRAEAVKKEENPAQKEKG
ncbi:hypothetical protein A2635_00810 [Candidatus Peribacteria bacterium RIFCSPHIGHO2_01_FULL_51_9]|nr:MAG: hypothetical protein A2635_00810 [Candidatus Peribacteria bacterium RIFCSPHIGHO2_01_FULL_51_9]